MNWFQKISQKYPGGNFIGYRDYYGRDFERHKKPIYDFDHKSKLDYWGIEPLDQFDNEPDRQVAMDARLSQIDPKQIQFAINHLADKYYPQLKLGITNSISNPCKINLYFDWNYNSEEHPEYDNIFEQLTEDLYQIVQSLLQKSQINDEDFSRNLVSFINQRVEKEMYKKALKDLEHLDLYVRVYGSSQAYGGSEEGGWWYDAHHMVHQEVIKGRSAACHRKSQLEKEYKDKGKDTFYEDLSNSLSVRDLYDETSSAATGMGDLSYHGSEGMDIPSGWKPSAFEKFFVSIEITEEPKHETRSIPVYE